MFLDIKGNKIDNSNVADIAVFESLQADQHAKTGMSQMSVFNTVAIREKAGKLEAQVMGLENDFFNKYGGKGYEERGRERMSYKSKMQPIVKMLEKVVADEKKRIGVSGHANPSSKNKDEQDLAFAEARLKSAEFVMKNLDE
ncbi:MAG: hypothetical protein LBQ66_09125 [Planctomycetaceae bacterium]|jgi:hypothetical protein|nr:hypothetical protein [Planctomycetaceae bacterium]